MATAPAKPPVVFISYSHDSEEHKGWVANLAERLLADGVDVKLDVWDLDLGDDVARFMNTAVTECDRVIMICTERYVSKADSNVGGVGYEQTIVTAELIENLGTNKFIPVVRQEGQEKPVIPRALGARFYVNLSSNDDEKSNVEYDRLLRVLHKAPARPKPPIGKNPYGVTPEGSPARVVADDNLVRTPAKGEQLVPRQFFEHGVAIAKAGDVAAWNRLMRLARRQVGARLAELRQKYLNSAGLREEVRNDVANEFVSAFEPVYALMVAGVFSGREGFIDHGGSIDEIVNRNDWLQAGLAAIVRLPHLAGFVGQALVGASLLFSRQLGTLRRFADSRVTLANNVTRPLWQQRALIGHPDFVQGGVEAWSFIKSIYARFDWLEVPFGDEEDYLAALVAYYMALSIHAFSNVAHLIPGQLADPQLRGTIETYIPPYYIGEPDEIGRQAYRLLTADIGSIKGLWFNNDALRNLLYEMWDKWIDHTRGNYGQAIRTFDVAEAHHHPLARDIKEQ